MRRNGFNVFGRGDAGGLGRYFAFTKASRRSNDGGCRLNVSSSDSDSDSLEAPGGPNDGGCKLNVSSSDSESLEAFRGPNDGGCRLNGSI